MDSFLTFYLKSKSDKLANLINTKFEFIKPYHITTFGLILNALALLNLLNNNFPQFILLFATSYYCSILDKTIIKKFNYTSNNIVYFQRVSEWIKFVSLYVVFNTLYKHNINYMIISIVIIILVLSNINFVIQDYNPKSKCIEFWKKCIIKILNKDSLMYLSNFTKYFDESMIVLYLIIIMMYLFYKK